MIQKTLKIKFAALLIVISVMTGLFANSGVSASESDADNAPDMNLRVSDVVTGSVSGTSVTGRSTIGGRMGSGSTSADYYDPYVTAYVSGSFLAVDSSTGYRYTDSASNTGTSSAVISFLAPTGYDAKYLSCYHSASKNGDTWSGNTSVSA